jgi:hypothetical protein
MSARAKLKFARGRWQKVEPKPVPVDSLEHRVDTRLFTIALNFNERFIAIETALAKLTAPAPRKRTRRSQPSPTEG